MLLSNDGTPLQWKSSLLGLAFPSTFVSCEEVLESAADASCRDAMQQELLRPTSSPYRYREAQLVIYQTQDNLWPVDF